MLLICGPPNYSKAPPLGGGYGAASLLACGLLTGNQLFQLEAGVTTTGI